MRLLNRLWAWVAYGLRVAKLLFSSYFLSSHFSYSCHFLCGFSHFSKQFYRHFAIIKSALKQKRNSIKTQKRRKKCMRKLNDFPSSFNDSIYFLDQRLRCYIFFHLLVHFQPIRNCLLHYNLMCNGNLSSFSTFINYSN